MKTHSLHILWEKSDILYHTVSTKNVLCMRKQKKWKTFFWYETHLSWCNSVRLIKGTHIYTFYLPVLSIKDRLQSTHAGAWYYYPTTCTWQQIKRATKKIILSSPSKLLEDDSTKGFLTASFSCTLHIFSL